MFLVEKAQLSSHFRSVAKKSSPVPRSYQLAARSFDERVKLHLKTLDLSSDLSTISLSWLSSAVSFLSTAHSEALDQISKLRSESDEYQALYMDYSLKILDLCNLVSSAVQQLTDRRLLMNLSLRFLNFSGQVPSREKLNKAKDALTRSINDAQESAKEKGLRAEALIRELAGALDSLPRGKTTGARDLIRRTFYALGVLTVFVAGVLVSVMYGQSDMVRVRVPAEFLWADLVNGMQTQIFDLIKSKQAAGKKGWLLEIDEMARQAVVVQGILDAVVLEGDDVFKTKVRLEKDVEELVTATKKFSDGIDGLTNGVNGLFDSVLKMRNGVLSSVRMGPL